MFSNTRLSCWLCPVSLFQSQTEPFSHPIAHRDSLLGWRAKTVMTCLGENTCRDSVIFPRSHLYSSAFTTHVSSVSRRGCHSTCLAPYAENFRCCLSAPVATSYTWMTSSLVHTASRSWFLGCHAKQVIVWFCIAAI